MGAAGYRPYRAAPGWGSLPLEAMVRRPPDLVFRAFFDSPRYRQDHWTASRHPVVARATRRPRQVEVPRAWLSCGNLLMGPAVPRLAAACRTGPCPFLRHSCRPPPFLPLKPEERRLGTG